jgi:hypothetical protein
MANRRVISNPPGATDTRAEPVQPSGANFQNMKIHTILVITLIALGLCIIEPARGELSLENYYRIKDSELFEVYLSGLSDGYEWANAQLAKERLPRLFCAPDNLTLNTINYSQILSNYLSKPESPSRFKSTDPIGPIVLMALREALPCP